MDPPIRSQAFDQTWASYAQDHARTPILKHRQAHPSCRCRFLHRVIIGPPSAQAEGRIQSPPGRPTYLRELCASFIDSPDQHRTYLLHTPSTLGSFRFAPHNGTSCSELLPHSSASVSAELPPLPSSSPVVLLLPGTDESCFDCEYLQQLDGSQSWIETSEREGFLLAICQSRGLYADSKYPSSWRGPQDNTRSLWLPKHTDPEERDMRYIEAVLEDIDRSLRAAGSRLGHAFVVGFSNGGFMAADLALSVGPSHRLHLAQQPAGVCARTLVGPDWRGARTMAAVAPWSVTCDAARQALIFSDGSQLKRVSINTGEVTVITGQKEKVGFADGQLSTALFGFPLQGLHLDERTGRLFVVDTSNDAVRVVCERTDTVTTLCVLPDPQGVALDVATNTLYIATGSPGPQPNHKIWRVNVAERRQDGAPMPPTPPALLAGSGRPGATDGADPNACTFCNPQGLLLLADGHSLLVCDSGNHCIRMIDTRTGRTSTWGGQAGAPGTADGPRLGARFRSPSALTLLRDGRVLVCDAGNARLRLLCDVSAPTAHVATLVGIAGVGFADGGADGAKFREVYDAVALPDGSIAVSDPFNHRIRVVHLNAQPALLARSAVRPSLRFNLAAVVCYMGGIDESQLTLTAGFHPDEVPTDESSLAIPESGSAVLVHRPQAPDTTRPDVLVVTGTRDMQVFSSQRAWDVFRALGFSVEFEVMAGAAHEYASASTARIWAYFKRAMTHKPPAS